ncbi:MGS domain protein [Turneriella parva]|uniref:MGS domain protein n=1 Tax=Turneriella parva (strain ATCC BAA-1111 / DSM 21527 / NCTC 11395 / H) TaxID=869212 RepID=I4B334_TURPD|nr:MGS domain protein [Turneriella parva]AFM11691.1 MGS domain protein [Turneriella parva DSM 21527]
MKITSMLLSVYHKDGLESILSPLRGMQIKLFATGGTAEYLISNGFPCTNIETNTGYGNIISGRVKSLHPKVFGGIVADRSAEHLADLETHDIPLMDCVVVDLYPFEATLKRTQNEEELLKKIDIGGVALIRAAAKHYRNVVVIPSRRQFSILQSILIDGGQFDYTIRKQLARVYKKLLPTKA